MFHNHLLSHALVTACAHATTVTRGLLIICLSSSLCTDSRAQSIPRERRIRYREQSLRQYEPFRAEELWKKIAVPPSPALSPAEALESFQVVPEFRIEAVAAEPLVVEPIMFEFDADGRTASALRPGAERTEMPRSVAA